ncbi:MAG TPA: heparan-alpha-glucosaminide N-acetyltransferase domain-containing protein [Terriglobales bacterium]|nr:heparan-alpha-glucosaminide N-acetyltransferase domain-containing protein [Terriglobales bacterium]
MKAPPSTDAPPLGSGRVESLDFFRGLAIIGMIIVNNPGGSGDEAYACLRHAEWNGWTPTDLIFPFFLFAVGMSMVYSFASRLKRGESRRHLLVHVLRRGAIMFAIGLFLNGYPAWPNHYHFATLRLVGVMQRIAICYVVASIIMLWCGMRGRIAAVAACLVGYWVLMRFVPVPGYGVPTRDVPLLDPAGNLSGWLDRTLYSAHMHHEPFDSEGSLSTIPALGTTLIGVLTGEWLRSGVSATRKAAWMVVFGLIGLVSGEIFNLWFPINKKLWTSSYVLLHCGFALVLLALCYWVLDIKQWRGRWTIPVEVFGINAIAAYILSEVGGTGLERLMLHLADGSSMTFQDFVYQRWLAPLASPANASLIYSLVFLIACGTIMWPLYRKRIYIRI